MPPLDRDGRVAIVGTMTAGALTLALLLAAICVLWIAASGLGLRVLRAVPVLSRLPIAPPGRDGDGPLLAILVPACDEARDAAAVADLRAAHASRLVAASTLAAASGRPVEILYIDDRSTDATGAILDEFAAAAAAAPVAVRSLHLRELPEGWLGKTHALQRGLDASRGEWVLLSDADVRLAPEALVRALGHGEAQGLDHLTLMPQLDRGGWLRDATLAAFGRLFCLELAAVNDPRSRASVGVGAFNLARRAALERIGGLRPVRLEVADDMLLARTLRRSGARQGVASGRDLVTLAWYRTALGIVRGLDKGLFAYGGRCEPWRLFAVALLFVALELGPWVALVWGAARAASTAWPWLALALLGGAALLSGHLVVALGERWMGRRSGPVLLLAAGGLIMCWGMLRAGWMGWRRGGVLWRGTLYPSALLRAAMAPRDR